MKDFDEFFKEVKAETNPVQLKLYGKIYSLPASIPAMLMLEAINGDDKELSEKDTMKLGVMMLGKENVEEWCETGLTMDQLAEIMLWYGSEVGISSKEEVEEVKSKAGIKKKK